MTHPRVQLESLGIGALKSFSQNFLVSPQWAEKLTAAVTIDHSANEIWEVGPGLGALTEQLVLKASLPIHVFEIDKTLAKNLSTKFKVQVHEGNFLDVDLQQKLNNKRVALLSNLPYHLSSAILFKILEHREKFCCMVLTFQRELAERITAKPRTKDYGSMSVLMQLCFSITSLGILKPSAFYPVPKVDSKALLFIPLPDLSIPYYVIKQVVRTAFSHRRKKLASNLSALFEKTHIEEAILKHGWNASIRPEEVSPAEFIELIKYCQDSLRK